MTNSVEMFKKEYDAFKKNSNYEIIQKKRKFVEKGYLRSFLKDCRNFRKDDIDEIVSHCKSYIKNKSHFYRDWFGNTEQGKIWDLYYLNLSKEVLKKYGRLRKFNK